MKTAAERQKALRDARKKAGLISVRFWLSKKQAKVVREFVASLIK